MPFKYASMYERLVANTAEPENAQACWLWTGKTDRSDYGRLNTCGEGSKTVTLMAHVAMAAIFFEIPEGHQVDHLCRSRPCINPDHLEPVTASENCRRRIYQGPP